MKHLHVVKFAKLFITRSAISGSRDQTLLGVWMNSRLKSGVSQGCRLWPTLLIALRSNVHAAGACDLYHLSKASSASNFICERLQSQAMWSLICVGQRVEPFGEIRFDFTLSLAERLRMKNDFKRQCEINFLQVLRQK